MLASSSPGPLHDTASRHSASTAPSHPMLRFVLVRNLSDPLVSMVTLLQVGGRPLRPIGSYDDGRAGLVPGGPVKSRRRSVLKFL